MALLHIPCTQLRPTAAAAAASLRPRLSISCNLPARDRIVNFGKHKGRMLGSLPSSYLQWVSKNLLTRDFEEWKRLADEVLQDPVYRDRIEWEMAERILTGNNYARRRSSSIIVESPVAGLIGLSERFGWDNEDKEAWARIDFELLGTSKGGRIPRVQSHSAGGGDRKGGTFRRDSKLASGPVKKSVDLGGKSIASTSVDTGYSANAQRPTGGRKDGFFDRNSDWRIQLEGKSIVSIGNSNTSTKRNNGASAVDLTPRELQKDSVFRADSKEHRYVIWEEQEEEEEMEAAGKRGNREERRERRERRKLKREQQLQMLRRKVEGSGRGKAEGFVQGGAPETERTANPFPGRSSLLGKLRKQGA